MYHPIARRDEPWHFRLSWTADPPSLVVRIHSDIIRQPYQPLTGNEPIVKDFMRTFTFNTFSPHFEAEFGFDGAFRCQPNADGSIALIGALPCLRRMSEAACSYCDGESDKDQFSDSKRCFFCQGTGYEYDIDWPPAYALSASLNILLLWLSLQADAEDTSGPEPQLLELHLVTRTGICGGAFGGTISRALAAYIAARPTNRPLTFMREAMIAAYGQLLGRDSDEHSYRIWHNTDGQLQASCPGNACDYGSDDLNCEEGGYSFSTHNVDSPAQQFTLLAGLAALCDHYHSSA